MRGYSAIALWNPKTPANVGGVLRAAGCYNANLVVVSGRRRDICIKRLATDTMAAWKHIPVLQSEDPFDVLPFGAAPIAVDLLSDATPLPRFVHPERSFYIFGPEDGTLRGAILERCKYRVMVPTARCMNLAAAVNVILYDRMAKSK